MTDGETATAAGVNDSGMPAVERRVWARLPEGSREAMLALPGADLQSFLMSVARARAAEVRPPNLVRRWREDRFVRPASADPRATAAVEARLWELLPPEIEGVELSPVTPLGTCSALGPVNQNRVVSATRSGEVVSDATNALAIEAADRRSRLPRHTPVHLAASHRLLRAQDFGPGADAHFRLFSLVSSARDAGSGATQAGLLTLHLGYWQRVLSTLAPGSPAHLLWTVFGNPVIRERITDTVLPALPPGPTQPCAADATHGAQGVTIAEEPERDRGRGYYVDAALRLTAGPGQGELGDGGFTTWTAQLLGNAKERCLISCISVDRLTTLTQT